MIHNQQHTQEPEPPTFRRMQWFTLIATTISFLGSIAASIIIKSPLPLSIGLLWRPIIAHLFPKDPKPN